MTAPTYHPVRLSVIQDGLDLRIAEYEKHIEIMDEHLTDDPFQRMFVEGFIHVAAGWTERIKPDRTDPADILENGRLRAIAFNYMQDAFKRLHTSIYSGFGTAMHEMSHRAEALALSEFGALLDEMADGRFPFDGSIFHIPKR